MNLSRNGMFTHIHSSHQFRKLNHANMPHYDIIHANRTMRTATRRKSARGAAVKVRNVLVSINIQGASGRDCLSGILQQIRSGMRWRVNITDKLLTNFQSLSDKEDAGFDGIITEKPSSDSDDPDVMEFFPE